MSFASPRRLRTRLIGGVAVGACALAGVAATSGTSDAANGPTMDIQILSFNDFHGNLEPPAGSSGRLVVDHYLDTTVTPNRVLDVTSDGQQADGRPVRQPGRQPRRRRVPRHPPQGSASGPPEHADRRRRRPHRRLAAALGRVPRRAHHRGAERAGPRRLRRSATTSSTRATKSCSGWPTAAASTTATARTTRTPARLHPFQGADFPYLAANVRYAGHQRDDPAAPTRSRTSAAPRSASSA